MKNNILFKFALDWKDIYGGHEFAMKSAAQELRNVNYFISQNSLNRLFVVPCLALITKNGLRCYATSLMPLGSNTLQYGSSDAGRTVLKQNETLNNVFKVVGEVLNLKEHSIARSEATIIGPVDIEGLSVCFSFYLIPFSLCV